MGRTSMQQMGEGMKKAGKSKLNTRIMSTIIVAMLFQIAIFVSIIFVTETPGKLDASAKKILENMVDTRCKSLEQNLLSWAYLDHFEESIQGLLNRFSTDTGETVSRMLAREDIRKQFLSESLPIILETLRSRNVTDCFVILENGTENHDTIFLRDLNPADESPENSDVMVMAGISESMFERGLTLGDSWTEQLKFTQSAGKVYEQAVSVGNAHGEEAARYLGHFSSAFRLRENDAEMISYMIPLMDEKQSCIGVIGVGISLDYLRHFLDSREIGIDDMASYCLGYGREDGSGEIVLVQGGRFRSAFPSGYQIAVGEADSNEGFLRIRDADAYLYMAPMRLYDSNTPFEDEVWFLGGIVRDSVMTSSSKNLLTVLAMAFFISLVVSIWGAYVITGHMTKPIKVLMKGIQEFSVGHVVLPRTQVYELDRLAEAVERQGEKVIRESARLVEIIHISNLPIGIIEHDKEADQVLFAGELASMLELPEEMGGECYVDRKRAEELIEEVLSRMQVEEDEEDVYLLNRHDGGTAYIYMVRKDTENETVYIFQNVTDTVLEKKKIRHEMDYDALTNLYNRSAFRRIVSRLMESGQAGPGVMAAWDLDHLKYVNDSYGHEMGDRYICLMAEALRSYAGGNFYATRRSGDEYMAYFWGEDVQSLREKVLQLHAGFVEHRIQIGDGSQIILSASGGFAVCGRDGTTYEELSQNADFALYESKRKAKGSINEFNWESYEKDNILMQGVGELNRILRENTVRYVYLPIVSVKDGSVYGYEALIHPVSDMILGPAELLRLAESQSRLGQVERLTWLCALQDFFQIQMLPEHIHLFLNSIPSQCLTIGEFEAVEKQYGEKLKRVVVELTENARAEKEIEERKTQFCRKNNMQIALDDFGAGYSNSDVLMNRSLDFVKINGGIISGIHTDVTAQEYVRGIINYCHGNGLWVVAEGIEDNDELAKVVELRVDYVQGLIFGEPEFEPGRTDFSEELSKVQAGHVSCRNGR